MLSLSPRLSSFLGWTCCLAFGLLLHFTGSLQRLDDYWLDWQFSFLRDNFPKPVQRDVVLIGIDEAYLRAAPEPLALMHRRFSELFVAVAAGKPSIVGLDIVLPEKSYAFLVPADQLDLNFDQELSRGLLKLGSVASIVIGESWDNSHHRFREIHPSLSAAAGQWVRKRGPKGFVYQASALVCPDADGIVRQYPGDQCQPVGNTPILVGQMAALAGKVSNSDGYINYALGNEFTYIPSLEIVDWYKAEKLEKLAQLNDKIVLIGVSLDSEDRLKAPVALVQWEPDNRWIPGFAIQAQLLRSLLNQNLIQPAPWLTVVLILVGSCFWFDFRLRDKAALFILFSAVVGIVSLIALGEAMLVQIGGAMAVALVSLSSSAAAAGLRQWRERQYLTQTFSGYVSPQVLKGILSGALSAGKEGQRVQACVLFSDIRGFTTLSENLPAERIVELLNSYFERMTNIVHQHGGLVDKFLGDGMMALFGTPVTLETPEKNALDAARAMLLAVDELNIELREKGLSDIRIGIGLHTGELLIGHIGSKDRHEYTAIGDVVNVAARVCDLPKLLGYPIVCTDSVASAVGYPPYLEAAGMQALKGRSDMPVYGWHP